MFRKIKPKKPTTPSKYPNSLSISEIKTKSKVDFVFKIYFNIPKFTIRIPKTHTHQINFNTQMYPEESNPKTKSSNISKQIIKTELTIDQTPNKSNQFEAFVIPQQTKPFILVAESWPRKTNQIEDNWSKTKRNLQKKKLLTIVGHGFAAAMVVGCRLAIRHRRSRSHNPSLRQTLHREFRFSPLWLLFFD